MTFLAAIVAAALAWRIADVAGFGLWASLALLMGLLSVLGFLTAPLSLASSKRSSAGERKVLASLLRRDDALQRGPRWLTEVGFGTPARRYTQRIFDVGAALLLLIVLAPGMLAIAIALKLESRGPVLFRRRVIGENGKPFVLFKFRSMYEDLPEKRETALTDTQDGVMFKIRADPRVTRVGRFLRRFSLDDLPQLWNVLKGDMSLVGPPPLVFEHKEFLDLLLLTKPGITGVWKVLGSAEVAAQDLVRAELVYFLNRSVWSDLMLCTVGRYAMRRRAITVMWNLAAEDRAAGFEFHQKDFEAVAGSGPKALLLDPELASKGSIG